MTHSHKVESLSQHEADLQVSIPDPGMIQGSQHLLGQQLDAAFVLAGEDLGKRLGDLGGAEAALQEEVLELEDGAEVVGGEAGDRG